LSFGSKLPKEWIVVEDKHLGVPEDLLQSLLRRLCPQMLDPPQSLHVQGSITLFPVDQMTLPVLITLALLLFVILAECP
jgi:hypothetical protein